jgi:hypothetical protein
MAAFPLKVGNLIAALLSFKKGIKELRTLLREESPSSSSLSLGSTTDSIMIVEERGWITICSRELEFKGEGEDVVPTGRLAKTRGGNEEGQLNTRGGDKIPVEVSKTVSAGALKSTFATRALKTVGVEDNVHPEHSMAFLSKPSSPKPS